MSGKYKKRRIFPMSNLLVKGTNGTENKKTIRGEKYKSENNRGENILKKGKYWKMCSIRERVR